MEIIILIVSAAMIVTSWLTPIKSGRAIGIMIYALFRAVSILSGRAKQLLRPGVKITIPDNPMPESLIDISRAVKLDEMQIVMGFSGSRPVTIDLETHHTLIGGVTGFGKTYILVSMLVQLFAKGTLFTDYCNVYLFDCKGDPSDGLSLWRGVVFKYFSVADDDISVAIDMLEEIANDRYRAGDKKILVIIDEVATLTLTSGTDSKRAAAAIQILASKIRSRGSLVMVTQHPRFDVLPRGATTNLSRKISVGVDDQRQAEIIFRSRPPQNMMPGQVGEFLIKEPGIPGYISGVGLKPEIPDDINKAVTIAMQHLIEGDNRLKLLSSVISSVAVGDSVPGVNNLRSKQLSVGGQVVKQTALVTHFRNFEQAGVFSAVSRGKPRRLIVDHSEAMAITRQYIDSGGWKDSPKSSEENDAQ